MIRNFFLQQEISSCDNKFLPLIKIPFCDNKFLPVAINRLQCQEDSSCDKKNFFKWQEIWTVKSNLCQNSVKCFRNFVWVWRFLGSLAPWLQANIPPWQRVPSDSTNLGGYLSPSRVPHNSETQGLIGLRNILGVFSSLDARIPLFPFEVNQMASLESFKGLTHSSVQDPSWEGSPPHKKKIGKKSVS